MKWEYLLVTYIDSAHVAITLAGKKNELRELPTGAMWGPAFVATLNELGESGWAAISHTEETTLLKRPIHQPPPALAH